MRKLNKAMIETWRNDANNIVFEKDGFISIKEKYEKNCINIGKTVSTRWLPPCSSMAWQTSD